MRGWRTTCCHGSIGRRDANAYGVYSIFKSMEQGPIYRLISPPKYPSKDPTGVAAEAEDDPLAAWRVGARFTECLTACAGAGFAANCAARSFW